MRLMGHESPITKAAWEFAMADPENCDKEWAAYLALVNVRESASASSPTNSSSPLHHHTAAAAVTAPSTTRSTASLRVLSSAVSTDDFTVDDLSPAARRLLDVLGGGSSSPTTAAPLPVPSSGVRAGNLHEPPPATPTSTRTLDDALGLEFEENSASPDLSIETPTRCSMECSNGNAGLFPSTTTPATATMATNSTAAVAIDSIHEYLVKLMSQDSANHWDQVDVYPPLADLRRALMTDVEWAAMSEWEKMNSIEGIVMWLPEAQRDQRRMELLEEVLRFGEPAPALKSSPEPASYTPDISIVLRVPTELEFIHDAADNLSAPTPSTCSTICPGAMGLDVAAVAVQNDTASDDTSQQDDQGILTTEVVQCNGVASTLKQVRVQPLWTGSMFETLLRESWLLVSLKVCPSSTEMMQHSVVTEKLNLSFPVEIHLLPFVVMRKEAVSWPMFQSTGRDAVPLLPWDPGALLYGVCINIQVELELKWRMFLVEQQPPWPSGLPASDESELNLVVHDASTSQDSNGVVMCNGVLFWPIFQSALDNMIQFIPWDPGRPWYGSGTKMSVLAKYWTIQLVSSKSWFECWCVRRESLYNCQTFQWSIAWPISCEFFLYRLETRLSAVYQGKWFKFLILESSSTGSACVYSGIITWLCTQQQLRVKPNLREIAWLFMRSYWDGTEFGRSEPVLIRELSFWMYPMPLMNQMALKVYQSLSAEDPIEGGLLIIVLLQDRLVSCFVRQIIPYGSVVNQWNITWSLNVQHFCGGNKFDHLSGCHHLTSRKTNAATFCLHPYVTIWNFCSMKFGRGKLSWNPGIWTLIYFYMFFAQSEVPGGVLLEALTYCYIHITTSFFDQVSFSHVELQFSEMAPLVWFVLSWDPGGSASYRLEVKPDLKEGGLSATFPIAGPWAGILALGACRGAQRQPLQIQGRGDANEAAWNGKVGLGLEGEDSLGLACVAWSTSSSRFPNLLVFLL